MGDLLAQLPPGILVEQRGLGEERHVLLDIEGSQFELHPSDARAIGAALLKVADETEQAEEART